MTSKSLTHKRLKQVLAYNPTTGVFNWKENKSSKARVGDTAGCIDKSNGYRVISIDGVQFLAHRLAWFYVHGKMPKGQIDHKSHCRDDNSILNLRDADSTKNNRNKSKSKKNTSGHNGVYWCSKNENWRARIKVDGKTISLGSYKDINDAVEARRLGDIKYGFHQNHGAE